MNLAYSFLLFKEIFFPRHCYVCHREIQVGCFCEACRQSFRLQKKLFWGSSAASWKLQRHWELEPTAQELLFDGLLLYRYEGALKELLHSLKFEDRAELLPLLREEVYLALLQGGPELQHWLAGFDIIACIPTSEDRLRRRGFDVPSEIFNCLGNIAPRANFKRSPLQRVKRTAPLYQLVPEERKAELAGCFRINPGFIKEMKWKGREAQAGPSILLCDDIVTTYGTMLEAAKTLLEAGAGRVSVLSFTAAKNNW